jgi:hypothetical protein
MDEAEPECLDQLFALAFSIISSKAESFSQLAVINV